MSMTVDRIEAEAEACDGRARVTERRRQTLGDRARDDVDPEHHRMLARRWRQIRAAFEQGVILVAPDGEDTEADRQWALLVKAESDRPRGNNYHDQLAGMRRVAAGIDSEFAKGLDARPRPRSGYAPPEKRRPFNPDLGEL